MVYGTSGRGHGAIRKDIGLVPPRAALGATMLYHGLQKLGPRREEEAAPFFESLGLRPARRWVRATAIAETVAGAFSLLGVLSRPAALAVLVTQAVAIAKVHAPHGFANTKGGYEFNVALMAMAAALLVAGPGRISVHELVEHAVDRRARRGWLFGRRRSSTLWAGLVRLLK